jgi:hypothetical protein
VISEIRQGATNSTWNRRECESKLCTGPPPIVQAAEVSECAFMPSEMSADCQNSSQIDTLQDDTKFVKPKAVSLLAGHHGTTGLTHSDTKAFAQHPHPPFSCKLIAEEGASHGPMNSLVAHARSISEIFLSRAECHGSGAGELCGSVGTAPAAPPAGLCFPPHHGGQGGPLCPPWGAASPAPGYFPGQLLPSLPTWPLTLPSPFTSPYDR